MCQHHCMKRNTRISSTTSLALLGVFVGLTVFGPADRLRAAPEDKPGKAAAAEKAEKSDPTKPDRDGKKKKGGAKKAKSDSDIETIVFILSPGIWRTLSNFSGDYPDDPFAVPESGGRITFKRTAKEMLENAGINFGPGASATYDPASNKLTVRNTPDQLELVEAYFSSSTGPDPQRQLHIFVEYIEAEHAEFSEWLFEHRLDTDGTELRSELQEWIRDGKASVVETMAVTARSGERSKVESGSEFIYPTEFDPPEIPHKVELVNQSKAPTTAVNPTGFETRHLGITLEVDPVIGADNFTISLSLAPEKVAIEGYTTWPNEEVVPLFKERMPTFHTMKFTTSVTVTDGRYAFLGTLRPRETTTEGIEDPVVLGFVRADVGVAPLPEPQR